MDLETQLREKLERERERESAVREMKASGWRGNVGLSRRGWGENGLLFLKLETNLRRIMKGFCQLKMISVALNAIKYGNNFPKNYLRSKETGPKGNPEIARSPHHLTPKDLKPLQTTSINQKLALNPTRHSYPSTRPGQKYIKETSYKAKNTKNWQIKVMGTDYDRRKKIRRGSKSTSKFH
jgi:hypothetical protein